MAVSRNSACPCGSGRKHKHCCLAKHQRAEREARFDDAVGRRIHAWSSQALEKEIGAALEEFVGPQRGMDDDDLPVFATWFHNDRELPNGDTPAGRYAARTDLPEAERTAAARIAAARLGLLRVLAVEPGSWILLEDMVGGTQARVRSRNVSRDAVRWDILLGRVMEGDPPSLWGPTRCFEPGDEPELLAELDRLAEACGKRAGQAARARALRSHALELIRFRPPGWSVEPSFFTVEGDPLVHGSATWRVHDPAAARKRLRALGGLRPAEPIEIDITVPREVLVKDRRKLPPRAIVLEGGPLDDPDSVPVATVRLERAQLHVEAMSEERLERAIELIDADFGDLAELYERELVPIEQRLEERRSAPRRAEPVSHDLAPADERRLLGGVMTDRMRKWLDESHPLLDGRTPREAAAGERRAEVIQLVRGIENGAERARRRGQPFADVAWIRSELGVGDELAA
ncbi:MAG: SEC-C domain-containing protein [Solirubrobacterales bacterium]